MKTILIASVVQLGGALLLAPVASHVAFGAFNASTRTLDEREELRSGNTAVGIVLAAVVVGTGLVLREALRPSSEALLYALAPGGRLTTWLGVTIAHLAIAMIVAVLSVVLAARTYAALAGAEDLATPLRERNTAQGAVLAAVIFVAALLVAQGVGPLLQALVPQAHAVALRIAP